MGLGALFLPNTSGGLLGYVIDLIVCVYGAFAKNRRDFLIAYLIFIALILMNFVGCSRVSIPNL